MFLRDQNICLRAKVFDLIQEYVHILIICYSKKGILVLYC